MDDERYSLQELADEAGVSVRTVRYYISEGLLPPPLKEIRRRLAALNDDELRQALEEAGEEAGVPALEQPSLRRHFIAPSMAPPEPPSETMPLAAPMRSVREGDDEALDYINRVLEDRKAPRRHIVPPRPLPPVPYPPPAPERTWRRLPIGEDAELVISDELYRRRKDRIDALITWAERMLSQD
jgi:DNA-binding transcriptional MerR regulator